MAKFVCIYEATKDGTWTEDLVKKHVEHLKAMKQKEVLSLCGVMAEIQRALMILEAKSREEAEANILKDPLIINKNYTYTIHEFIEANEENNYLLDK